MRNSNRPTFVMVFLLFALLSCATAGELSGGKDAPPEAERKTRLVLGECEMPALPDRAQCGALTVPENRETGEGRKIDIHVAVIPAKQRENSTPPVFVIAGGPGTSAIDLGPAMSILLPGVNERHDIVLVDQRGTGRSNRLDCPLGDLSALIEQFLTFGFPEETLAKCRAELSADLRLYTTTIAMDDLDEVRQQLGYEKIHLWGGSYGTRAALVYMRRHPEHVSGATLRAVVPPSERVPMYFAKDSQVAIDDLFSACAADARCHEAFPDPAGQLSAVLDRLGEKPHELTLPDGTTARVTRDAFAGGVLFALYHSGLASYLPQAIDAAHRGDFGPWLVATNQFLKPVSDQIALGMFLSVICAEDLSDVTAEMIGADTRSTFLGPSPAANLVNACRTWPQGEVSSAYRDPIHSEAPVLLISGEVDPSAAPRMALDVSKNLPNSRHLLIPATGHIPTIPPCVGAIVAEFIDGLPLDDLDFSCVESIERPPFAVN